jgi:hypothetical protein
MAQFGSNSREGALIFWRSLAGKPARKPGQQTATGKLVTHIRRMPMNGVLVTKT